MDTRTETVGPGVWRVEVSLFVNAYVVADDGRGDDGGLTVVDTGMASGGPRIVRSIRRLGLDPTAVRRVLLTHWHADHAGSAQRFATASTAPRVLASAADAAVVRGDAVDPPSSLLGRLVARGSRPPACRAAEPFDGTLPPALQAVPTPGHTAGHTAFWLPDRGVVLTGDAIMTVPFVWRGPRWIASDPGAAAHSVERIASLGAETIAPGHGRVLRGRAVRRLETLARRAASPRLADPPPA